MAMQVGVLPRAGRLESDAMALGDGHLRAVVRAAQREQRPLARRRPQPPGQQAGTVEPSSFARDKGA